MENTIENACENALDNASENDPKLIIRTAVLAGELLLKSGAEVGRVEDTMMRILQRSNCKNINAICILTGIVATIDDEEHDVITYARSVRSIKMNISHIVEVNRVSRSLCAEELTFEEAYDQLKAVGGCLYSQKTYALALIVVVFGFALFFDGSLLDSIITAGIGVLLALLTIAAQKWNIHDFFYYVFSGIIISFVALVADRYLPQLHSEIVIIGGVMSVVPGIAITNGVRDILAGNLISGNARMLSALLTATGISLGIAVGMWLYGYM